jgi:hypothetical protein
MDLSAWSLTGGLWCEAGLLVNRGTRKTNLRNPVNGISETCLPTTRLILERTTLPPQATSNSKIRQAKETNEKKKRRKERQKET